MNEEKRFLNEFEYPTYEDWKEAAIKALKGAPFDKKMFTKTYEDITLEPIYTKEHTENLELFKNQYPGFYPYVRGTKPIGAKAEPWKISQNIPYPAPKELNKALKNDLEKGQTAIKITADEVLFESNDFTFKDISGRKTLISSVEDFKTIFKDIDITKYPVYLDAGIATPQLAGLFAAYCRQEEIEPQKVCGAFEFDVLGYLAEKGKIETTVEDYIKEMYVFLKGCNAVFPNMKTIIIKGNPYHNGGGNAVQEIAYILSTGVFYIKSLLDKGIHINSIAKNIKLSVSTGSNFFMEIAKIRALRVLWAKIIKEFGGNEESQKAFIHATTSEREMSKYDPYVNMLRNTSQAFSAVVGGCDSLHVSFLDQEHSLPDRFTRRLSRNTQIILNEEAHVNDNVDPAGGSWFVETLTSQVAGKAWDLFKETEKEGGILEALIKKIPQTQIKAKYDERIKNLSVRKDTILGTNKYPNLYEKKIESKVKFENDDFENYLTDYKMNIVSRNEELLKELKNNKHTEFYIPLAVKASMNGSTGYDLYQAFLNGKEGFEIEAIPMRRSAEIFENLRDNSNKYKEENGEYPKVDLVCFGLLKQYKPRADFSSDFYQVGGFECNIHDGFENGKDAADKMLKTNTKVMVICSTDDIYESVVVDFAKEIKSHKSDIQIVLAGYPKDKLDEYKAAGVDEFIHIRANNYQLLSDLHNSMNIA